MVREVRDRYGAIARGEAGCCGPQPGCCGAGAEGAIALSLGYSPLDLELLPDGANLGLGCGAPIQHLELAAGETVLDLGCGAGVDLILAARAVGPAGLPQVDLRRGRLESLPLDDGSVDAVTSNCVINLVPDKAAVFREIHRVLRPGGRMVISDVLLDGRLPEAIENDLLAYVGCVAGAVERSRYFGMLEAAGLGEVEVLRDVDFLAALGGEPPREIADALEAAGIDPSQIAGIVRSVTFRARRPGPGST